MSTGKQRGCLNFLIAMLLYLLILGIWAFGIYLCISLPPNTFTKVVCSLGYSVIYFLLLGFLIYYLAFDNKKE